MHTDETDWATDNDVRLTKLRHALNRRIEDEGLDEDKFETNEALIVHMLDDVVEIYEDLAKRHYDPAYMFEEGEYNV